MPPQPDTPGQGIRHYFGSAHPGGLYMALCDGSVQFMNFTIDPLTHKLLGDREDDRPIDVNKF